MRFIKIRLFNIVNSQFWLTIFYIGSILSFALIYYCISKDFYHSTVQYEVSYKEEKKKISEELKELIISNYSDKYKKLEFELVDLNDIKSYHMDINDIRIENLEFNLPWINFEIKYLIYENNEGMLRKKDETLKISMNCGSSSFQMDKTNNMPYTFNIETERRQQEKYLKENVINIRSQQIEIRSDTLHPLVEKFPPFRDLAFYNPILKNRLITTSKINKRILYFKEAGDGFPYKISGTFSRMIYFSATTQTGLGPGDILPLTNRARLFVVFQAILGIVIMGLFLNAIGNKVSENIKKSNNTD